MGSSGTAGLYVEGSSLPVYREEEEEETDPTQQSQDFLDQSLSSNMEKERWAHIFERMDSDTREMADACDDEAVHFSLQGPSSSEPEMVPFGVENVMREIKLLRRLTHPNIVSLVDVMQKKDKQKLYMVLEFCVGSLQDIKPGNLLFGLDGTLKISDMGVAEEISPYQETDMCTVGQGTPKFQPPEIACGKYDEFRGFPIDWWSSGVTLYNMVSGEYPFEGQGQALLKLYDDIVYSELKMPKSVEVDGLLEDFLRGLLQKNPEERLDEKRIRKHEWFLKGLHTN